MEVVLLLVLLVRMQMPLNCPLKMVKVPFMFYVFYHNKFKTMSEGVHHLIFGGLQEQ